MKKNNMFRIASVLLVAVLLSTCAISGAFAKYTTSGEATDSARVAKFGITVTGAGEEIFAETYESDTDTYADATVSSTVDVVAPGTEGALAAFNIQGTAEVAVAVKVEATDLTLSGWTIGQETYCPIIIKVGTEEFDFADCADDTELAAKITEVKAEIAKYSQNIAAGAAVAVGNDFGVSWTWPTSVNDEKDTELGRAAYADNAPNISLTVKVTVEQID